ncbi:uncharacterized protein EV420DRAFT_1483169 [Desarmillaria tabescens]|uniref:Uncharacterized protein n=1 Tax=Armillaria tabescens TaxID=1929756 RepID=A0AA39JW16_ARMTA|nr:uncharacterized protein EV420DRAFT_1483169 [Desarmillaria tabescens]KAK0449652.1 hypothetical protein EV420DRAFT_1483169 [Desarmillaria tabescens]
MSRNEDIHTDLPIQRDKEDMEGEIRVGRVEEQDDADRREQQVLADRILRASADPSDEESGATETRVNPTTGGVIVGPETRPRSTRLYLTTAHGEEVVIAYHGFSPRAPDPDEIPEPEEFHSQQQHDWAIMDAWHQANR